MGSKIQKKLLTLLIHSRFKADGIIIYIKWISVVLLIYLLIGNLTRAVAGKLNKDLKFSVLPVP
jgi:hypothetical protein